MQLIVDAPRNSFGHPPRTLFGYEVLSFLGEGAASAVYAVSHPETGQIYALKHVLRKDEKHQRYIDQLVNEYEVSRRVVHPNIRRCFDVKLARTMLLTVTEAALIMELIDAHPLDVELGERGGAGAGVDVSDLLHLMTQAARGMAALNTAGYVHCDMKPGNIMVGPDRVARVIDLGHACPNGTVKKRIQGSPHFISPEQFKLQPVTFRTDVFNFGATLYWALTGRHVPTYYTRAKGLAKGASEDAPPPADLRPGCPRSLSELVMQCVHSNVLKRPDSMSEVANRLEAIRREHTERDVAVA
ncbi:MAG: serine/threonine-protein kinase [Tepidisphaerales bacterium]